MSIDQEMRDALDRAARDVDVPEPALTALVGHGRASVRSRRARQSVAGAAACAVLAAGVVATVTAEPSAPGIAGQESALAKSVADLPQGEPPATAYCADGTLHWAESEVRLGTSCGWPVRLAQAGGRAVASDGITVFLLTEDGILEHRTGVDHESSPLAISAEGTSVAWVSARGAGGEQHVVLWDLDRMRETARVAGPAGHELNLEGIDDRGRVFMTTVEEEWGDELPWVWDGADGEGFRRITGTGELGFAAVTADGVSFQDPSGGVMQADTVEVRGEVTERNAFVESSRRVATEGAWSPDGERFISLAEGADPEVTTADGDTLRLKLPASVTRARDGYSPNAFWETDTQVIVAVTAPAAPQRALLRCDAESGECELTAEMDTDYGLPLFPGYGPVIR